MFVRFDSSTILIRHRVMVFGRINYSKIMNTDGSATQITNIHAGKHLTVSHEINLKIENIFNFFLIADEIIFLSGGKEAEEVEVD